MGVLAGAAVYPKIFARNSNLAGEVPIIRFVQFNDAHMSFDGRKTYKGAKPRLCSILDRISREKDHPLPDLAIALGDICNGGSGQKGVLDNALAAVVLGRLQCPVMATPGNHDFLPDAGRGYFEAFGRDATTYAVEFRGVLFVLIDNSDGQSSGTPVSDARNREVREIFARHPQLPKIVACHIPLVPFRDPEVLAVSTGHKNNFLHNGTALREIIEENRDTVICVLNGHVHLTGRVECNGVTHITPSGTAPFPCDYGEYALFADRLEVRMRMWGTVFDETRMGDDHSKNRLRNTDSTHDNHREFVRGREDERRFVLPLTGARRPGVSLHSLLSLNDKGWIAPNTNTIVQAADQTLVENLSNRPVHLFVPIVGLGQEFGLGGAERRLARLTGRVPVTLVGGEKRLITARAQTRVAG